MFKINNSNKSNMTYKILYTNKKNKKLNNNYKRCNKKLKMKKAVFNKVVINKAIILFKLVTPIKCWKLNKFKIIINNKYKLNKPFSLNKNKLKILNKNILMIKQFNQSNKIKIIIHNNILIKV